MELDANSSHAVDAFLHACGDLEFTRFPAATVDYLDRFMARPTYRCWLGVMKMRTWWARVGDAYRRWAAEPWDWAFGIPDQRFTEYRTRWDR